MKLSPPLVRSLRAICPCTFGGHWATVISPRREISPLMMVWWSRGTAKSSAFSRSRRWRRDTEGTTLAMPRIVPGSLNTVLSFMLTVTHSNSSIPPSVSPKITTFTFGQPKHFGAMVSVQCILGEGDLPVKILWKFNGKLIESDYGIMISALGPRVSNMMIESVEGRHAGNYTCSVENRAGIKSYTANLEVIGTYFEFFSFLLSPFIRVP